MSTDVGQNRVVTRHLGVGSRAADLVVEGALPSFDGATAWLNSPALTPDGLRGRVVLVQFWTYTCINWLRTLPYVRSWAEKYKAQSLVVIGVHTPEFGFEKQIDNVRRAAHEMGIDYPIAIDSDYSVWRTFANHYWPALYFADAQGNIRHHRFGEGDYERSEMVIQQLLAEAGIDSIPDGLVAVDAAGSEAAADWVDLRSPENYLGHAGAGQASCLYRTSSAQAESLGTRRRLDGCGRGNHFEPAQRTHRVSVSLERPPPRDGTYGGRKQGPISCPDRRTSTKRRTWR